jgi:hypothetical protein
VISYVKSLFLTLHSAPNTLKLPTNRSKDDTKLSTNDWVIPISILSAVAITVPINYLIFKRLESSSNTPTNTIEMLEINYLFLQPIIPP